ASPPTPVARGPQGTIVSTPNPTGPSPTVPAEPAFTVPAPASPESPRPGKRDSNERYQILEELGRGGLGVVYRAEDRMLQREVAYKVLPENILGAEITPESLLAEARAAARLSHPNIVQVYDAGRKGQGFFIVMELVRGETLEALLTKRAMSIRGVIQVGRQVLAALAHAHERRLIHRDLKPSNLIWGDDNRIKLSDFGLARAFEATVGNVRTQPAGTPSYMSPEQIRGEPVSPSTDLYAFGCVLWEMLCRQPVFGTGAPSFHHHLSSSPRDPREVRADIPEPLAALVLQCLAKSSGERPSSAVELAQRLAEMLPPKA
ncbi:MAG: serine/threonine-protein kinase, partial [Acidobacteriota bacterium]